MASQDFAAHHLESVDFLLVNFFFNPFRRYVLFCVYFAALIGPLVILRVLFIGDSAVRVRLGGLCAAVARLGFDIGKQSISKYAQHTFTSL